MSAPALRLASRRRGPSVIVDMTREQPTFTSPWTLAEIRAAEHAPVPQRVVSAAYVAAWACAEGCGLCIVGGRLEPTYRFEPTDELLAAFARSCGDIVGVLGFGVPLVCDGNGRARGATWHGTWGGN